MYQLKCAVSVRMSDADNQELLDALKEQGITALEIAATDICAAPLEEQEVYLAKTEKWLDYFKEQGFILHSFHMNFGPYYCLFNFDDKERAEAVERTLSLTKRVAPYGFKYVVTHTNGWDFPKGGDRRLGIKNLKDSYRKIVKESPLPIAAEVLPRNCLGNTSKEMLEILDGIDGLKTVVDVNHIMQEKESDCIRALGSTIIGLHVSDRDNINERHWLPGKGIVDFNDVISALEEIGYNDYFTYEVAAMKTAEDVKNVAENYKKLFLEYNSKRDVSKPAVIEKRDI